MWRSVRSRRRAGTLLAALLLALFPLAGPAAPAAAAVTARVRLRRVALQQRRLPVGGRAHVAEFDSQNHWLIDRGDGRPSVNLVVLSFVNPLRLLNQTTDAAKLNGVPRGMTQDDRQLLHVRGIRVMLSIGGITYTDDWDTALAAERDAARPAGRRRGDASSASASRSTTSRTASPNLTRPAELHHRLPGGPSVRRHGHRPGAPGSPSTSRPATAGSSTSTARRPPTGCAPTPRCSTTPTRWCRPGSRRRRPRRATGRSTSTASHSTARRSRRWRRPSSPAALYIAEGSKVRPECNNYGASVHEGHRAVRADGRAQRCGTTAGMLGFMFWAAERPSTRGVGTVPPNTCEGGVGAGATALRGAHSDAAAAPKLSAHPTGPAPWVERRKPAGCTPHRLPGSLWSARDYFKDIIQSRNSRAWRSSSPWAAPAAGEPASAMILLSDLVAALWSCCR